MRSRTKWDGVNLDGEEWRPIPGFPLYLASNLGRVRSLESTYTRPELRWRREESIQVVRIGGYLLTPRTRLRRKLVVCLLVNAVNEHGEKKALRVHRAVLMAFCGVAPDGMEGCHNDGNPLNNRLSNLRWDTHISNIQDCISHGRKVDPPKLIGDAHPNRKISMFDESILRRTFFKKKGDISRLAKLYGVRPVTISRLIQRPA